jgi:CHAT domain-containing protein
LLSENSAMVEYFSGDSTIYIFTFTKDEFDIIPVKKPDNFTEVVKDFYSSILKSEFSKYYSSATALTGILIKPVLDKIAGKENLIFVPDDILFKIPFEALFTDAGKIKSPDKKVSYAGLNYLIKKCNISYHYSAGFFADQINKNKFTEFPLINNFAGFAPVFAGNNSDGYTLASTVPVQLLKDTLRSSPDNNNFSELKYSEWELRTILELFEKNRKPAVAFFHSDATEENFRNNIDQYGIIHIASHSFINEVSPQISGVAFARGESNNSGSVPSDGILYAGETYSLDLDADLLVLSSCESGIGKLVRGEGMMSLTRGFLYSGTDNIIFSLWKIPDKHTSELMVSFYRKLFSGKNYAEALKQAKLEMIKNESTARPRSWAGFLLIGAGL